MNKKNNATGTSGNRPGFKVFSFNTSVRNPKRNTDFLQAFIPFEGKLFDENAKHEYLCELVKNGVYQFVNVPEYIKLKWKNNEKLTDKEINDLMDANPQATGFGNRVLTSYTRTLKDQGFLMPKESCKRGDNVFVISKLGYELLDAKSDKEIVYTKAMIGVHANNPSRTTMYNESRPFLNTLFVIDGVNKLWEAMGNEPKGILKHEFSTFVLSMKDCDYKKTIDEIIKYRKKFKYRIDMNYINKYLQKNNLQPLSEDSICKDYPDDVFRKFEMTGLVMSHGKYSYKYYNISNYNKEKVKMLLQFYANYKFEKFNSIKDYYEYMFKVEIPWQKDVEMRRRIARTKAEYLGRQFNESIPLEAEEMQLDRAFYTKALDKAVQKYDISLIYKELLILAGEIKEKTQFDIPDSLRLEYLLALSLGKRYGTEGLVSNIVYNEDGEPMHCAAGNKCDMIVYRETGCLILEPTMITSKQQQQINETSSVFRHARDEYKKRKIKLKVIMVAPRIHPDTIDYFTLRSTKEQIEMMTLTISKTVGEFAKNSTYEDLYDSLTDIYEYFDKHQNDLDGCADYINSYKVDKSILCE